jgi:hypothetical protein
MVWNNARLTLGQGCACREGQKHVHENRGGHDDADIENGEIPAAQLAKHQNIVFACVRLALSKVSSNAKCFSTQLQHTQWRCLAE